MGILCVSFEFTYILSKMNDRRTLKTRGSARYGVLFIVEIVFAISCFASVIFAETILIYYATSLQNIYLSEYCWCTLRVRNIGNVMPVTEVDGLFNR